MDVGALTWNNDRKGRKHETPRGGSDGSSGPLFFRGFLGEIRNVDYEARDSFWGTFVSRRVVEPQYVPPVPAVKALIGNSQIESPIARAAASIRRVIL